MKKFRFFFLLLPVTALLLHSIGLSPLDSKSFSAREGSQAENTTQCQYENMENSVKKAIIGVLKKKVNQKKPIGFDWVSLWPILYFYKRLVVDDRGNKKTLCVDKILPDLIQQAIKQQKTPFNNEDFDFNGLEGEALDQVLQFLELNPKKGRGVGLSGFFYSVLKKYKTSATQKFFSKNLKTAIAKMMILGYREPSEYDAFDKTLLQNFHLDMLSKEYFLPTKSQLNKEKKIYEVKEDQFDTYFFEKIVRISALDLNKAHTHLEKIINKDWTPKLQTLQQARDLALISIPVGKKSVDVSSLVNSQIKEVSELSLEQLKILKQLKTVNLVNLKTTVQNHITKKLDQYKPTIQSNLNNLASAKVNQLTIGDKTYDIDQLLIKSNLNKSGSKLQGNAKTQLLNLVKTKITKSQLDTALNQVLTARENQIQKEKEEKEAKDKKTLLTIGLATGGGVFLLAGGFLYLFYKIKK